MTPIGVETPRRITPTPMMPGQPSTSRIQIDLKSYNVKVLQGNQGLASNWAKNFLDFWVYAKCLALPLHSEGLSRR